MFEISTYSQRYLVKLQLIKTINNKLTTKNTYFFEERKSV